jgi:hypothetical protein
MAAPRGRAAGVLRPTGYAGSDGPAAGAARMIFLERFMDHKQEHELHHRKEREEKKRHEREHEEELMKKGPAIHPLWFLVLGIILTVGAVLVWIYY